MSGPVQAKPANDLFINLALGTLVAAAAFTGLLRVAGSSRTPRIRERHSELRG